MDWTSLGKMVEKKYETLLKSDESINPGFAHFRLRPSGMTIPLDPCLTCIDGLMVMVVDFNGDKGVLEKYFPELVDDVKQAFGKSEVVKAKTRDCLVFVFHNEGEEDLAENTIKKYLR